MNFRIGIPCLLLVLFCGILKAKHLDSENDSRNDQVHLVVDRSQEGAPLRQRIQSSDFLALKGPSGLPNLQAMKLTMEKVRKLQKRSQCLTGILGGGCSHSKTEKEGSLVNNNNRNGGLENNNSGDIYKNP